MSQRVVFEKTLKIRIDGDLLSLILVPPLESPTACQRNFDLSGRDENSSTNQRCGRKNKFNGLSRPNEDDRFSGGRGKAFRPRLTNPNRDSLGSTVFDDINEISLPTELRPSPTSPFNRDECLRQNP
jgi:hypothetical protein